MLSYSKMTALFDPPVHLNIEYNYNQCITNRLSKGLVLFLAISAVKEMK